jgi:hypothetical protein
MATLLQDNFDRANSTTVVGAPQVGPTPTVPTGVAGISSNQLYGSTAPVNIVWNLGTTDVEISALFSSFGASNGCAIILGYAGALQYWLVSCKTTTGIELFKQETAGFVIVTQYTGTTPNPAGATVKVHYKAGILRVYLEGTQVIRWALDVPITSTSHGIRMGSTAVRTDNILAIDAPTITEPTLTGEMTPEPTNAGDPVLEDGFVYLGRDTKLQDVAAGA